MKNILKKIAGLAIGSVLVFGMTCCSNPGSSSAPSYYRKCAVGDFILKDGKILGKDTDLTDVQKSNVAAVIVRAAENGKPALGVGIVQSSNKLAWCTKNATGYEMCISGLKAYDEGKGYSDGGNSWDILVSSCKDLKEATAATIETAAQEYPAFNYCRKYGAANGLSGDLAKGWYLPTIPELEMIYQNKATVNASLSKAGGSLIGREYYWSSCQNAFQHKEWYAWQFSFNTHKQDTYPKSAEFIVCCVRAFN